jgi:hypothetical protein
MQFSNGGILGSLSMGRMGRVCGVGSVGTSDDTIGVTDVINVLLGTLTGVLADASMGAVGAVGIVISRLIAPIILSNRASISLLRSCRALLWIIKASLRFSSSDNLAVAASK